MSEPDPNIALVQHFYECYASQDYDAMRTEVLADDVAWLIPGHHPLAGWKHSAEEIVAFFSCLTEANFQAEVTALAAAGDWVIDLHRGWGRHEDLQLDMMWVLAYRIENGRIREVRNFAQDQAAADQFFWTVWAERLAPLPGRLATAVQELATTT